MHVCLKNVFVSSGQYMQKKRNSGLDCIWNKRIHNYICTTKWETQFRLYYYYFPPRSAGWWFQINCCSDSASSRSREPPELWLIRCQDKTWHLAVPLLTTLWLRWPLYNSICLVAAPISIYIWLVEWAEFPLESRCWRQVLRQVTLAFLRNCSYWLSMVDSVN